VAPGTVSKILVVIPSPVVPQFFIPIVHFQWDSISLVLYLPGGSISLGGDIVRYRVLSGLLYYNYTVFQKTKPLHF